MNNKYNRYLNPFLIFFKVQSLMKQLRPKELKKFLKDRFKHNLDICLFLDNIQYTRNVAELFRIADAARVNKLYMSGITPKPPFGNEMQKVSRKKELRVNWESITNPDKFFTKMLKAGYLILALEITDECIDLPDFELEDNQKILIILGNEVNGISSRVLKYASKSIMIPMYGKGASLNVSVSAAIVIYYFVLKNYVKP